MGIRKTTFKGFFDHDVRVAYLVRGKEVYFTGLSREGMPTSQMPERVIYGICKDAGLDWRKYRFYDILCRSGYSGFMSGDRYIYLLNIHKDPDLEVPEGLEGLVIDFRAGQKEEVESLNLPVALTFLPFIGLPLPSPVKRLIRFLCHS